MKSYIKRNCKFRKVLEILKSGKKMTQADFVAEFPDSCSTLNDVLHHIKRFDPQEYQNIFYYINDGKKVFFYEQPSQLQSQPEPQPQPQPEQTTKSALDRIADALEKLVNACVIDTNVSLDELRKQQFTEMAIRLYTNKNEMYNH